MSHKETIERLNSYVLINHESGISSWHIALTNDVIAPAKNTKFGIYQEAKEVFDALVKNPKRNFETVTEVSEEHNPLWVSIWETR